MLPWSPPQTPEGQERTDTMFGCNIPNSVSERHGRRTDVACRMPLVTSLSEAGGAGHVESRYTSRYAPFSAPERELSSRLVETRKAGAVKNAHPPPARDEDGTESGSCPLTRNVQCGDKPAPGWSVDLGDPDTLLQIEPHPTTTPTPQNPGMFSTNGCAAPDMDADAKRGKLAYTGWGHGTGNWELGNDLLRFPFSFLITS
ncbi:hypothetical protein QBC32DRAFT_123614 [Pseudoneurospora amorphoporcata]|uniref:Uncharacterized protein n=1 Tax=Pseudoneurospora amorphoporcata TaxID=241081 RepID=A0AAN6SGA6_9PEZI|nr:hypothetical protein QBC32DRAFT_123614 [Pseudoneurospora amorphoporcata]